MRYMKVHISIEMEQDIHSNMALIRGLSRKPITDEEILYWQALRTLWDGPCVPGMIIRTPDPTEEEVKDWQVWYWKINRMDLTALRTKVQFFGSDEPLPYQDASEAF